MTWKIGACKLWRGNSDVARATQHRPGYKELSKFQIEVPGEVPDIGTSSGTSIWAKFRIPELQKSGSGLVI